MYQRLIVLISFATVMCTHSSKSLCGKGTTKLTLPYEEAARICEVYGMPQRASPVRIYDAFMFNSELDMLEVRLNELSDVVDYFVIAESRVTHQNDPKALYYSENKSRFARFEGKIVHITIDNLAGDNPYYREWDHREHVFKEGLRQEGREARHGDIIISGDLDEVPKPEAVEALRRCGWARQPGCDNCAALEASMYYYSYSNYAGQWGAGPKAFVYEGADTMGGMDKNAMRYKTKCDVVIKEAAWHCTDCFSTLAAIKSKISSFLHWEKNRFPYNDSAYIVDRVVRGLALFNPEEDGARLESVDPCTSAPPYVLANADKFGYMLERDNATGGFADYAEFLGDRTDVVGNFHAEWTETFTCSKTFKI